MEIDNCQFLRFTEDELHELMAGGTIVIQKNNKLNIVIRKVDGESTIITKK